MENSTLGIIIGWFMGNWTELLAGFLGLAVCILGVLFLIGWLTMKKCPKCRSKDINKTNSELIGKRYKYPTKSGGMDRRYKDNPLIKTFSLTWICKQCGYSWKETKNTLGNHDNENHIINNNSIEDNAKREIQNTQDRKIDDSYNISKIKNGKGIEDNKRNQTENFEISKKSRVVTIFFTLFLGNFGFHRFYVGKWLTGLLYLVTFGFLYVGVIIDLILLLINKFRDAQGRLVI